MAEVHSEGNPHSSSYPEILGGSFNLIIQKALFTEELGERLHRDIPQAEKFTIHHKRNGEHIVFQFKAESKLS